MDNIEHCVNENFGSNYFPCEERTSGEVNVLNFILPLVLVHLLLLILVCLAAPCLKDWVNMIVSQGKKRSKDLKIVRVFVIDNVSSYDQLLQFHRSKSAFKMNYIGIDCEWVSKKGQENAPVALLQIATPLCDCFLVRLCKMDGQMPQVIKEVLEDRTVLKFGVGIQNDAKRLLEMFGIHAQGCVDLRDVAQRTLLANGDQRFVILAHSFILSMTPSPFKAVEFPGGGGGICHRHC